MEKIIKIPTSGKKKIYGKLRGPLGRPLVVFVHGMGALMDQHIYYNGSRFLEKHGISSFRFNLYGWDPDARKLSECTLETHAVDLDRVIAYFRKKKIKKIFVVGHSLGAPVILLSKSKDYDGVVFWDPSYGFPRSFLKARYLKSIEMYWVTWNMDILLKKEMVQSAPFLKQQEEAAIKKLAVPIKIITAGKSVLKDGGKQYYDLANQPKARVVIKDANHTFDEDGVTEKLYRETLSWIKKYGDN